jgi:pimeloyl-ACP methyl ester carboxylesterase
MGSGSPMIGQEGRGRIDRRMLILSAMAGTVGASEAARAAPTVVDPIGGGVVGQTAWRPDPPIKPSWTGMIQVAGARLWAWDSGGSGEPIVLLHPFTGSDAIWGYQYEAFTRAGHRVVAYSRRGFGRSEQEPSTAPTFAADDLNAVADARGLDRFHLVGSAGGAFIGPDYALSHPERLFSLTLANSLAGINDPAYQAQTRTLTPEGFMQLPPEFRELGPSYRFAYPEGVARWVDLERHSASGPPVVQKTRNAVTLDALASIRVPVLLLTGDADLFMPPTLLQVLAKHFRGAELVMVPQAGHSAYWEQPTIFNDSVLRFLSQRGRA